MDASIVKRLNDRVYDKRKNAAKELEEQVKVFVKTDPDKINAIIGQLSKDFAYAVHKPDARNGGLIGLAATAIALGQQELAQHLDDIIHPVLACFGDQDAQVRYYASESLFNIAKVARGEILRYFNEIFDVLCKLSADSDVSVKSGADLLDRLIKDIVHDNASSYISIIPMDPEGDYKRATQATYTSNGETLQFQPQQNARAFSLPKFIPLLMERINTIDPFTRVFLVSWITTLNAVPDLELVSYLPAFLGGLLNFLGDSHTDVRVITQSALDLLLHEIRRISEIQKLVEQNMAQSSNANSDDEGDEKNVNDDSLLKHNGELYIPGQDVRLDYPKILEILISHIDASDAKIQIVVLNWLESLLEISPMSFIPYLSKLLSVILLTMANNDNSTLKQNSKDFNSALMELIKDLGEAEEKRLNYSSTINQLTSHFLNENEETKMAVLDWLKMLYQKSPEQLLTRGDELFTVLLKALSDSNEQVIHKDLQLLSEVSHSSDDKSFSYIMVNLLDLYKKDQRLLETRGNFILRKLCISLDPVRVYQTLGNALENEKDITFASIIIQILNNNLITAPELSPLRRKLRKNDDNWVLFTSLFKAWCHNAPATLALCLWAQAYELAYAVLQIFVEFEITVNTLVQIDVLVQLLESPVFTRVRLQLLEPENHPYLYKCLYGILMVLPQSSAFSTLKNRLNSVNVITSFPQVGQERLDDTSSLKSTHHWDDLLNKFSKVQQLKEDQVLENATSINNVKNLPKYDVSTPSVELRTPTADTDQSLSTPKPKDLKSAVRKISGRSFVLKGFGGDR
ncbi:Vac14p [Cyberlindnera jadinii NRRL Y-1542]|uniref:ARM repeat-containing protein n=1 Tax=Cyberlindnera jadinii (strain ATCC 18201 / CBS 1600 / BCRC 20928 / JCM 3617 / NBRC 0987 / NRRL Y-1542) TaxID=983966 RepID=A0A1E4S282_CYBJN|nr:ARM repeat-containing protein [Cyberlindnera jadinii NRRL Y-1542]ODV73617.1 ARM repeat-containing protein [Cyberlindnera jadinii NRRL Y-1542]